MAVYCKFISTNGENVDFSTVDDQHTFPTLADAIRFAVLNAKNAQQMCEIAYAAYMYGIVDSRE